MKKYNKILIKSITVLFATVMLFSCSNNAKEVRDFLASKNLPVGKATDAYHVYKDSGKITSKLITPLLRDFSNRKKHPYSDFPEGIKIINFEKNGIDSVTIVGDYAIHYPKTTVSELVGNVEVINHTENTKLLTEQLFWDQKTKYYFSEKPFTLTTSKDTIFGIGFECKEDLSKHLAKKTTGKLQTLENK